MVKHEAQHLLCQEYDKYEKDQAICRSLFDATLKDTNIYKKVILDMFTVKSSRQSNINKVKQLQS